MKLEFDLFLLLENLNGPMPHIINSKGGYFLALIGPPAAGKTSFANKFVKLLNDWVHVDPDNVNKILTLARDKETKRIQWHNDASRKFTKKIYTLITGNTKPNIIFDNTGNNFDRNTGFLEFAKENGYKTGIVLVLNKKDIVVQNNIRRSETPIKTTIDGSKNIYREIVSIDYVMKFFDSLENIVNYYMKGIGNFADEFYVALNTMNGFNFKIFKWDTKSEKFLLYDKGQWVEAEDMKNPKDFMDWTISEGFDIEFLENFWKLLNENIK
jgi:GTPase SAR1 family protein